jgi:hypothetical protein
MTGVCDKAEDPMTRVVSGMSLVGLALLLVMVVSIASAEQLHGKGEWQSLTGDTIKGTWAASLTRRGAQLEGTFTLTGSNVFKSGPTAGSIDGSNVVLGLLSGAGKAATFSAKLDGDSISGEWESPAVDDHGVWTGNLSPAKGE